MPDGIDIPTKPEWNTRQLTERGVDPGARETMRLYHVEKKTAGEIGRLCAHVNFYLVFHIDAKPDHLTA